MFRALEGVKRRYLRDELEVTESARRSETIFDKAAIRELTEAIGADGIDRVLKSAANAVATEPQKSEEQARLTRLTGVGPVGGAEAAELAARITVRSIQARENLLRDTVSSTVAADMLGVKPQTVRNRVKRGALLAVREGGDFRVPVWQFDREGEDGVIHGLPEVLKALDVPPFSQIRWLTRPNPYLEDRTPLEALKQGEIDTVVAEARGVGVA